MSNYSWFKTESEVHIDDRRLYEHLQGLRKKNDWAALVCDWYENPRKKDHQSRKLKVPSARSRGGLPRFTFSVFDGCVIHGYWETAGVRQLLALLAEIEPFLGPAAKSGRMGRADFVEDGGESFSFVIDYRRKTIRAGYYRWTWVEPAKAAKKQSARRG
ncbi:MAG: hypothetical protein QM765_09165 [Myxococcales bacterium]